MHVYIYIPIYIYMCTHTRTQAVCYKDLRTLRHEPQASRLTSAEHSCCTRLWCAVCSRSSPWGWESGRTGSSSRLRTYINYPLKPYSILVINVPTVGGPVGLRSEPCPGRSGDDAGPLLLLPRAPAARRRSHLILEGSLEDLTAFRQDRGRSAEVLQKHQS